MTWLASLSRCGFVGVASLVVLLGLGCSTELAPRVQEGTEEDSESCRPTLLLAARDEHVEVATEWEDADLVLIGCADRLQSITKQQLAAVAAALKSAEEDPAIPIRTCRGVIDVSEPSSDALAAANELLGSELVTDWCWATRMAEGW